MYLPSGVHIALPHALRRSFLGRQRRPSGMPPWWNHFESLQAFA